MTPPKPKPDDTIRIAGERCPNCGGRHNILRTVGSERRYTCGFCSHGWVVREEVRADLDRSAQGKTA